MNGDYSTGGGGLKKILIIFAILFTIFLFAFTIYTVKYKPDSRLSSALKRPFGFQRSVEPIYENKTVTFVLKSRQTNLTLGGKTVQVKIPIDENTTLEEYTDSNGKVSFLLVTNKSYRVQFLQGNIRNQIYEEERDIQIKSLEIPIFLDEKGVWGFTNFREIEHDEYNEANQEVTVYRHGDYTWDFYMEAEAGAIRCPIIRLDGEKIYREAYLWSITSENLNIPEDSLEIGTDYQLADRIGMDVKHKLQLQMKGVASGELNFILTDCGNETEPRVVAFVAN